MQRARRRRRRHAHLALLLIEPAAPRAGPRRHIGVEIDAQSLITVRFLDRVEICPLDIFDNCDFQGLPVSGITKPEHHHLLRGASHGLSGVEWARAIRVTMQWLERWG